MTQRVYSMKLIMITYTINILSSLLGDLADNLHELHVMRRPHGDCEGGQGPGLVQRRHGDRDIQQQRGDAQANLQQGYYY